MTGREAVRGLQVVAAAGGVPPLGRLGQEGVAARGALRALQAARGRPLSRATFFTGRGAAGAVVWLSHFTVLRLSVRRADPAVARRALERLAELKGADPRVVGNVVVMGARCDLFLPSLELGVSLSDGLSVVTRGERVDLAEEYQQLYIAMLIAEAARAAGFREVEGYAGGGVVELVLVR